MKKQIFTLFLCGFMSVSLFAGGILTNTNQSARYVRMISMNSTLSIDGVYYNPAGLTRLNEGWHLSLGNQFISQNLKTSSNYPLLVGANSDGYKEFNGTVSAPIFPNFYAAWKKGRVAVSFGFNIVGGGGSADFDKGMAIFELPVSQIPAALSATQFPNPMDPANPISIPTTGYQLDMGFDGTSMFMSTQLGITYEIVNDDDRFISLFAGARYVWANNHYDGYLNDIMINPNNPALGQLIGIPLDGSYTNASQLFSALAASPIVPAAYVPVLEGYAAAAADKTVDVTQTGSGWTPMVGVNFSLDNDRFVLSSTYEFKTNLVLTNDTKVDGSGMFPDKAETNSDLPGLWKVGASYSVNDKVRVNVGLNEFFDNGVNWDGREADLEHNYYELLVGGEYTINETWLASVGYQFANSGAKPSYHTPISYSLDSHTVGGGVQYTLSERFVFNAGVLYSQYIEAKQDVLPDPSNLNIGYTNTYNKNTLVFAIGVDFHI